jgi:hypothetical protein
MQQIALETLAQVTGGASKSSTLTTALTSITTQLSELKNTQKDTGSSFLLPLVLLAANRKQHGPTVVSAGGSTVVA